MVKRLTRIAYSLGLSARFAPHHCDRARDFAFTSRPRAALDTLSPSPSSALLSAQEATELLREIVERFFFRRLGTRDRKRVGRLLLKNRPGLGKTREAIHWAIRHQAEQQGKDRLSLDDVNEAGSLHGPRSSPLATIGPSELVRSVKR